MGNQNRQLPSLSLKRPISRSAEPEHLPELPERRTERSVAPDRRKPTEGNGLLVPPTELHIALIVPHKKLWIYLEKNPPFVINPPLWKGTVKLHVIPDNPQSRWNEVDWTIRQALLDTGLADADQVEFAPPHEISFGWPIDEPS